MSEAAPDGSMKQILHSWATPWGIVRLVDGPRPSGMGMETLNAERNEWQPCAPMEMMFTKEILRLLCEVRRLTALLDNEKVLHQRALEREGVSPADVARMMGEQEEKAGAAQVAAHEWRCRYENLHSMWLTIGDSLAQHGYVRRGDSSDTWPARIEGLLRETEALRDRENQFAQILKDRESSARGMLKERADQTNHAIRVNREEAGQAGYDRALADIAYTVSVGMIAAERRRQVEQEGWTGAHDDGHVDGQLALAAACYAIEAAGRGSVDYRLSQGKNGGLYVSIDALGLYWPFDSADWKPGSEVRNLVKAGALISAEIDRRLRAGEAP